MSFLLDKKLEHETACEQSIRSGNGANAIFHAAKAAEFAYALADQTGGPVGKRYIEDAEGWLEIAERLKANPPRGGAADVRASSGPQAAAEEESPGEGWLVTEKPSVTFAMIAGMEDAKQSLREMVVYPLQNPEAARKLKVKAGGGVLLFGPPGTGKTTLAKAAANELNAAFFYASGAEVRSKWHGESEKRLRSLLQAAKAQPVSILFLDDVDGLLPQRSGNSVVDNRLVVQFLSEVGGFEDSGNVLMILGATNNPWDIDDAVFRTGRFDEKLYIGLLDVAARAGILRMHLDGVPAAEGLEADAWAARLEGYTGSDIVGILNAAKRACLARTVKLGGEPVLTVADMEDAFRTIPASVTPAKLRKYEEFMKKRFG